MMWIILIKIFVSAGAALLWCLLVTFCCMYIEHLLFKRPPKPALSDKEIILVREVLAGNISLPLAANGSLVVQYADRIEQILERFITRSSRQMEQLAEISKALEAKRFEGTLKNEIFPEPLSMDRTDTVFKDEEPVSGLSYREILDNIRSRLDKREKENLLQAHICTTGLPKNCCSILQKKMGCNNVKDLLHLMLRVGNRKSLLKIYGIGEIYAHKLEAFMFENGLIYLEGYAYKSGYQETARLNEPNEL